MQIITTIGALLLAYSVFIRPFTTETKINDERLDNAGIYALAFFLIIIGLVFGIWPHAQYAKPGYSKK